MFFDFFVLSGVVFSKELVVRFVDGFLEVGYDLFLVVGVQFLMCPHLFLWIADSVHDATQKQED